jgi:AmmeMemoRadiSam system protein A
MSQQHNFEGIATGIAEYPDEERKLLLRLAHRAIAAKLRKEALDTSAPSARLAELRGAFTTLHRNGKLRGCIGYILPLYPLYQTIADTAVAAAFHDPRFVPVTIGELPELEIEISVLSQPAPIEPEEVQVGRHGLIVTLGAARGLLLPQVPLEWGWDREQFLSETCHKAGLPPDAWKHGARLEGFTAEVFGESQAATTKAILP